MFPDNIQNWESLSNIPNIQDHNLNISISKKTIKGMELLDANYKDSVRRISIILDKYNDHKIFTTKDLNDIHQEFTTVKNKVVCSPLGIYSKLVY
jgi:hypothetical protein